MSRKILLVILLACLALTACAPAVATSTPVSASPATASPIIPTPVTASPVTASKTPILPTSTATPVTPTAVVVESLNATVTAERLSCRYGPGSEYLFLYGLRKGAKITLIGQTGGNNWVWVDGSNKCWVNTNFIEIEGDPNHLPIVYPGASKLPISPYYPPTTVLSATRDGNEVTVSWLEVPISPGDYEDESMQTYLIEVWRCEAGRMIFDPLATNETSIVFVDVTGCSQPSHGRVFVQEKHGFAGPADIPWP